jgi:hypothetical protein
MELALAKMKEDITLTIDAAIAASFKELVIFGGSASEVMGREAEDEDEED